MNKTGVFVLKEKETNKILFKFHIQINSNNEYSATILKLPRESKREITPKYDIGMSGLSDSSFEGLMKKIKSGNKGSISSEELIIEEYTL